ncbi:MFS transporter [Amantichitinum ursilacus]|uniref:Purine efflux pump PbuE n=1 Tax=Amantichitinum ursilacus TaxID=857265 RepID=A0A0N0GN20_9NEIS|nr:MFS transporter [Amantichitinum ursilacus]KPC52050.1 Purine efflux pump PbuE [Amantichitinum ursilacus]
MAESTPTSARTAALYTLTAAYFTMGTNTMAAIGGLPAIAQGLHSTPAQIAPLTAVFALTFAIAAPLIQMLFGHLPRRRLLMTGLLLAMLGALASALARDVPTLMATRVLTALGAAAIGPVASAIGTTLVAREHHGRALATVFMGMTIASVVSLPLTTWLAAHVGWRVMFMCVAALNVSTALAVLLLVRDGGLGSRLPLPDLARLLLQPGIASGVAVVMFEMGGFFISYTLIVPLLHEHFGMAPGLLEIALVTFGVAGILGNFFARAAADRWAADKALTLALSALAIIYLTGYVLPPFAASAFAMLVAWAVANDLFMPSQQRRLVELAPDARAMVLALNASALYLGMSGGSALSGWIDHQWGTRPLLLASALAMLGGLMALKLSRQAQRNVAVCAASA